MKFAKIRDVKSPCRGTPESSGIDLFVPNYSESFVIAFKEKNPSTDINNMDGIRINPRKRVLIPSGIKIAIPQKFDLVLHNKSGVASKKGLLLGACVVDQDYTGEILISFINTSDDTQFISFGEKVVQAILREVNYEDMEECSINELNKIYSERNSKRGDGGFGSTGVN